MSDANALRAETAAEAVLAAPRAVEVLNETVAVAEAYGTRAEHQPPAASGSSQEHQMLSMANISGGLPHRR